MRPVVMPFREREAHLKRKDQLFRKRRAEVTEGILGYDRCRRSADGAGLQRAAFAVQGRGGDSGRWVLALKLVLQSSFGYGGEDTVILTLRTQPG